MEKLAIIWKKNKLLILLPLLITATLIYSLAFKSDGDTVIKESSQDTEAADMTLQQDEEAAESDAAESIYVDVGGAVVYPGVVKLSQGDRIYQAVDAAGGTLPTAVTMYMNLAQVCEDGEKIYVPTQEEVDRSSDSSTSLFSTDISGNQTSAGDTGSSEGKININTADSTSLQTLTGIGPSMAQRIIDYRNKNGNFTSTDDLTQVSGIGDKTLEKIRDEICV